MNNILDVLRHANPAKQQQILSQLLATYETVSSPKEALAQMRRDLATAALEMGGREVLRCVHDALEGFTKTVGEESLAAYEPLQEDAL